MRLVFNVGAWALCCFHSLISTQTFRRALTASVDSCAEIKSAPKLQALVYDILPSTTAVFSYAIGSRKLSASNEQFFVGVVSLLQLRLYQTFVQ